MKVIRQGQDQCFYGVECSDRFSVMPHALSSENYVLIENFVLIVILYPPAPNVRGQEQNIELVVAVQIMHSKF